MIKDKLKIKLQKGYWNVLNVPVAFIFWLHKIFRFPTWEKAEFLNANWQLIESDDFSEINDKRWRILEPTNWGSARPDNVCVYTPENITCDNSILSIHTVKKNAIGTDFEGNQVFRQYTSGWVNSKFTVPMSGIRMFRAKIRCNKDLGSWKAYWLYKDSGKRYQEIDGFEQFAHSEKNLSKWSTTTHWGPTHSDRTMFGKSVKLENSDWMIFDIIVNQKRKRITVKINGVTSYISGLGCPNVDDELQVIFSDCASLHKGKITVDQISENVPYLMEIDWFKHYRKVQ